MVKKEVVILMAVGMFLFTLTLVSAIVPACKNLYWYDNFNNSSCGYKEFCGLYMYQGLRTFHNLSDCESSLNPGAQLECNYYYYFDMTNNKICRKAKFCGAFMYYGLRTFSNINDCKANLPLNLKKVCVKYLSLEKEDCIKIARENYSSCKTNSSNTKKSCFSELLLDLKSCNTDYKLEKKQCDSFLCKINQIYSGETCVPKNCEANFNNSTLTYVSKDPKKCMRIRYSCSNDSMGFSDECGCGCAKKPVVPINHLCTSEQRNATACIDLYKPVCGWFNNSIMCLVYPCAVEFSNECYACSDPSVESWTEGACPSAF